MKEIDWTIDHDCISTPDGCAALVEDEGGDMVPCKRPERVHPPEIALHRKAPSVSIRTKFGILEAVGGGAARFAVMTVPSEPFIIKGTAHFVTIYFRLDREWKLEESACAAKGSGPRSSKDKKRIIDSIVPVVLAWTKSADAFFREAEIASLDRERYFAECRARVLRKEIAELEAKARKSKERMKEMGA